MKLVIQSPSRIPLKAMAGSRVRVTARFVRYGARRNAGARRDTVLVRNVRDADSGELLADHLWFNRGNRWRSVGLIEGDVIRFDARPIEYRTGYWGPSKLRQIQEPARREFRLTPPEGLCVIARVRREQEVAA